MSIRLTERDRSVLAGERGEGEALAMRVLIRTAEAMGARELLTVSSAHIDGCLYHGQAGLDFARALLEGGARTRVRTTLNVGSLDLLHPDLVRLDGTTRSSALMLMETYEALGCRPTWTCAPYQLEQRPAFGEQIAWAESNAIVFANSVLGARTERYGDFLDICAAVTGRAPAVGLHLDHGRRATLVLDAGPLAGRWHDEAVFPLLGYVLGRTAGAEVTALIGLPDATSEDHLKALGAAAASAGSVALFHAVGITPEAPTLEAATGGQEVEAVVVEPSMLSEAQRELSSGREDEIDAVSVGTPHYSLKEMQHLRLLLAGRECVLPLYVNTGRHVLEELGEVEVADLERAGARIVTDTCTYITPILDPSLHTVMTDSAKWAYYAPSNTGVDVVFGSTAACVEAAVTGRVVSSW